MQNTLALIPIAAYIVFLLALRSRGKRWRDSILHAATIWGVSTTVITESLSSFHKLGWMGLTIAWSAVCLGATFFVQWRRPFPTPAQQSDSKSEKQGTSDSGWVVGVALIVFLVGLTALLAPPNTWDSMEYHMPRIIHWLRNRTVAFYATHGTRQLQMQPWAEYAILQLHGLSGGDRLDNLVQWFSLAGSVIGVTSIAELLGASAAGQVLAGVICATIPQGILEASGAKNDCVVGFWLVVFTYYILRFRRHCDARTALGVGASLGLAGLTKTTAFVLAPPILLAFAWSWKWRELTRRRLLYLCLASALGFALNFGHFARNYSLFQSPFGPSAQAPPKGFKVTNDRYGLSVTLSNVLRNIGLHLGSPSTALNGKMESVLILFVKTLGEDANDPATTWDGTSFHVLSSNLHESTAGDPLHLALVFTTIFLLLLAWRSEELRITTILAASLIVSFVLFCAAFKWQPWHTRLHLPLFLLWSAVSGRALTAVWPRHAAPVAGTILLFAAIPSVVGNQVRPLMYAGDFNIVNQPRVDQYFADNRALLQSYLSAAAFVKSKGCRSIGIDMEVSRYEYPLLALLNDLDGSQDIRPVNVSNPSRIYGTNERAPCTVICAGCTTIKQKMESYSRQYPESKVFDTLAVFSRSDQWTEPGKPLLARNECSAKLLDWYAPDRSGGEWWVWSSGDSKLFISSGDNITGTLAGELYSLKQPNTAQIWINGQQLASINIKHAGFIPFLVSKARLNQGDNLIEFKSKLPSAKAPGDPRNLTIALKNPRFVFTEGRGCTIEP